VRGSGANTATKLTRGSALQQLRVNSGNTDIEWFTQHVNLTQLSNLSLVADRLPYANGTSTMTLATFTAFARTILDDTDAASVRATIDLDVSGKGWVNHGSTAGTARPSGYASVEWYGTATPSNMITGDTWIDPT
jgi:hypothetical protein